jgi:DNA (cytosine-5)-methyltransferase 1
VNRPGILDLFCGGGGAAKGYYDAGFDVTGVDIKPQPRYPYPFLQMDALEYLEFPLWSGFAAIHVSPPCQRYSRAMACNPGSAEKYPDLIGPVRNLCQLTGLPFVIENVPGSPLVDPVTLCGSHFGLTAEWPSNGRIAGLQRHRGFEAHGFVIPDPGPHDHSLPPLSIVGSGGGRPNPRQRANFPGPGFNATAKKLMEIDWMNRTELSGAIPPAYTKYVGTYLMAALEVSEAA